MEWIEKWPVPKNLFVFDLEFIGDVRNVNTCRIWEIAVYSVQSQQWFEAVVDPDPTMQLFPEPPIPQIPQLTREFLTENAATTWQHVFANLKLWVEHQSIGMLPVFISHNTFRADKPIMEMECRRYDQFMPFNWFFFDSLHYSRRIVKNSSGNYSLSGLHQQLFSSEITNAHRARADVVACTKILSTITKGTWALQGPIYPVYTTSLRTIRWIGQKAEEILYKKGIGSVEELFQYIQKNTRRDKIQFNMSSQQSSFNSLNMLFQMELPQDNIQNISKVIHCHANILCFTFMHQ